MRGREIRRKNRILKEGKEEEIEKIKKWRECRRDKGKGEIWWGDKNCG